MIQTENVKIRVYPSFRTLARLTSLDRLYSEWSNNKKLPYMNLNRKRIKNIAHKERDNGFGYRSNKSIISSFKMPSGWLDENNNINPIYNYLSSIKKYYRKIYLDVNKINVSLSVRGTAKYICLTIGDIVIDLPFRDNRPFIQSIKEQNIKTIKLTIRDFHKFSEEDISREAKVMSRFQVYVTIGVQTIIQDEYESSDLLSVKNNAVGIDIGQDSIMTLSRPLMINGMEQQKIKLPAYSHMCKCIRECSNGAFKRYLTTKTISKYRRYVTKVIKQIYKQVDVIYMEHDLELNKQKYGTGSYINTVLSCVDFCQYMIKKQAQRYGKVYIQTPRNFASSHVCSNCGAYADFSGTTIRQWTCCYCGIKHDRDVNAAVNIHLEGKRALEYFAQTGRRAKYSAKSTGSCYWAMMV